MIGHINLSNIERGVFQNGRLGYSVDENFSSKGVITQAISMVVNFAFGEIFLHRVEANIIPRNISSRRVLEKNGFTKVGSSPDYLFINGRWEDHDMYMKLNENFVEKKIFP